MDEGVWKRLLLHDFLSSYLLLKRIGFLSGRLVSSASVHTFFVEFSQRSNDLVMNLWGRMSYSATILGPPHSVNFPVMSILLHASTFFLCVC